MTCRPARTLCDDPTSVDPAAGLEPGGLRASRARRAGARERFAVTRLGADLVLCDSLRAQTRRECLDEPRPATLRRARAVGLRPHGLQLLPRPGPCLWPAQCPRGATRRRGPEAARPARRALADVPARHAALQRTLQRHRRRRQCRHGPDRWAWLGRPGLIGPRTGRAAAALALRDGERRQQSRSSRTCVPRPARRPFARPSASMCSTTRRWPGTACCWRSRCSSRAPPTSIRTPANTTRT